jgi:hypothetical protein
MDSIEAVVLGRALGGSLSAGLTQQILGGLEFVPAYRPLVSADDFGRSGAVSAPTGVTSLSQDPAQE